jgi:hypothetical protein
MVAFSCASSACWAWAVAVEHKFSKVRAHVYVVTIMLTAENVASSFSD